MVNLSLVLATYGRSDLVGRLIASLECQTNTNFELIVVDQNFDERIAPYIDQARAAGIPVSHLRMSTPNLSAARNWGIAQATGSIVAFPDDDCWYEPEVVEKVLAAFSANRQWSGLVAQWVEATQDHLPPTAPILLSQKWRQFRGGDASSITLFFKTELLRNIGGFDDRLGVGQWFGAGEETDLILTALSSGALLARCPNICVRHRFDGQSTKVFSSNWREAVRRARGTGALYIKHSLSFDVMFRGFISPPLNALLQKRRIDGFLLALAVSAGRVQGALSWVMKYRSYR